MFYQIKENFFLIINYFLFPIYFLYFLSDINNIINDYINIQNIINQDLIVDTTNDINEELNNNIIEELNNEETTNDINEESNNEETSNDINEESNNEESNNNINEDPNVIITNDTINNQTYKEYNLTNGLKIYCVYDEVSIPCCWSIL